MFRQNKLIFWIALISIFIFVVVPIAGHFTPLEITNESFKNLFEVSRFFGLPIMILCTLFGTITKNDTSEIRTAKITVTIVITIFSIFLLIGSFWSGMCLWSNGRTLFDNKNDKTTKIIVRDFGCGATDSGSPILKVCKIKNITSYLIWVTEVDTTKIDKKIWTRIDEEN